MNAGAVAIRRSNNARGYDNWARHRQIGLSSARVNAARLAGAVAIEVKAEMRTERPK